MPSTASSIFRLELMANGENDTTWGSKTNTNLELVEQGAAQWTNVDLTGSGDYTLTATNYTPDESRTFTLNLTGTLAGNRNVIAPAVGKPYIVVNNTSGSYTVTLKPTGGTGVLIPQGGALLVAVNTSAAVAAVDRIGLGFGTAVLRNVGTSVTELVDVSIGDARYLRQGYPVSAAVTFTSTVDVQSSLTTDSINVQGPAWSIPVTATFSTSTSLNFALGNNFVVSVSSAGVLTQPAGLKPGQSGFIWLYMASAGCAVAYDTSWKFQDGTDPTNTTTAGAVDLLVYVVRQDASAVDAALTTNRS